MSIGSVMPIQPSYPLLSPSPLTFNLSQHQGLFQEPVLHVKWPKYCNFSFSISPSNEYSGLISFRMEWFDLLAVQGTLKSPTLQCYFTTTLLLQHYSSKTSTLVLSFLYGSTLTSMHDYWKNHSFD